MQILNVPASPPPSPSFSYLAFCKLWTHLHKRVICFDIKALSWYDSYPVILVLLLLQRSLLLHSAATGAICCWKAVLHFLQDPCLFHLPCVTVDFSVSPSPFPCSILPRTPPPAMEMNSVLWIWGWRWGLQQISNPACKRASWLLAKTLQVLSSQPAFLSAITWPWIPRQRNVHAFFF